MRLKDRIALITGATGGIGRAAALAYAAEGACVWLVDIDEAACQAVADEIRGRGGVAQHAVADVRSSAELAALMARVDRTHGRLDVLLAAAGVLRGAFQPIEALDEATWDQVIDTNLKGTYLTCHHAAPLLVKSAPAVVLLIGSIAGVQIKSSSFAYAASKAGLHGMLRNFEAQFQPLGVRCHVICPDAIATPMKIGNVRDAALAGGQNPDTALAAARDWLGDPAGLAKVLTFLASDDADYVRGTIFTR